MEGKAAACTTYHHQLGIPVCATRMVIIARGSFARYAEWKGFIKIHCHFFSIWWYRAITTQIFFYVLSYPKNKNIIFYANTTIKFKKELLRVLTSQNNLWIHITGALQAGFEWSGHGSGSCFPSIFRVVRSRTKSISYRKTQGPGTPGIYHVQTLQKHQKWLKVRRQLWRKKVTVCC